MNERMDWDKLRVFRVVAEVGSMSRASARLAESVPTISRKIDELEKQINARVLNRTTRGVTLTESGLIVLRHAQAMADAAEAIDRDVAGADLSAEGPVALFAGEGLGNYWIAPQIPRFHLSQPKIHLRLSIGDGAPDLLSGEFDVAVQFREPDKSPIISRRLGVVHYIAYASREYIDTYGAPVSLFEAYEHRCILYEGYVHQLERWLPKVAELKRIIDFAVITNSATAMVSICAAGGGIAVLPSYMSQMDPRLIPLDLPELAPAQFWLTYTERIRRLDKGKVVLDWMRNVLDPRKIVWFRDSFVHPNSLTEDLYRPDPHLSISALPGPDRSAGSASGARGPGRPVRTGD